MPNTNINPSLLTEDYVRSLFQYHLSVVEEEERQRGGILPRRSGAIPRPSINLEPITSCQRCGATPEDHTILRPESFQMLCPTCFDSIYTTCADSGNRIRTTEAREVIGLDGLPRMVGRAQMSNYAQLADGRYYHTSTVTYVDSYGYVANSELATGPFFQCVVCNNWYHNDSRSNNTSEAICRECASEIDQQREWRGQVLNYSTRIRMRPQGQGPHYLGVELEVEVNGRHEISDKAQEVGGLIGDFSILKSDGSIDRGFEIVTCPMSLDKQKEGWERFFENRPRGLKSWDTTTCGMHVHVSRAPLTELQIAKMMVFLNLPRNGEFIQLIAGRGSNRYCEIKEKKIKDVRTAGNRYEALNLTNQHTVEFRIFRGTLNKPTFMKNMEFCSALVAFCASTMYSVQDSANVEEFVKFVLRNRKTYNYLAHFLTDKYEGSDE